MIRDRTKSVAEEFSKLVFPEDYNPQMAPKKTSVSCSKQARPEPVVDVEGVERMLRDGQVSDAMRIYTVSFDIEYLNLIIILSVSETDK